MPITARARTSVGHVLPLVLILLLAACGIPAEKKPLPVPPPPPRTFLVDPSATEVLGGCVDATDSTGSAFGAAVRDAVADVVKEHLPPKPPHSEVVSGVAPVPGLMVELRLVTTRPLGQDDPHVAVTVPGVPGLKPQPDVSDPTSLEPVSGYTSLHDLWTHESKTWSSAYDAAARKQQQALKEVQRFSLDGGMSGITGCMSALAQDLVTRGKPRFLLASDLQENVTPQLSGSLRGQPVVVVQPCPSGVAATCDSAFARVEGQLKRLHAGPVTRHTVADLPAAVAAWATSGA